MVFRKKRRRWIGVLLFLSLVIVATPFARADLPLLSAPLDSNQPGSKFYPYDVLESELDCGGRAVNVFLPKIKNFSSLDRRTRFPVIVFGHGQALGLGNYRRNFTHLAGKGVAVVYPTYDTGFFDQDWKRMGKDYDDLTSCALQAFSQSMNPEQVVFSGHSKGAYVALSAAGVPQASVHPKALVAFEPAGYVEDYLANFDPNLAVTLVWSEADNIVSEGLIQEIYEKLSVKHKQRFVLKNYPRALSTKSADHFYPLTQGFFGESQETAFHYYAVWKWLLGAAWDMEAGEKLNNPYIYGISATDKGAGGLQDEVIRNWIPK